MRLEIILGSILIAGPIVASAQSPSEAEKEAIRQLERAKAEAQTAQQQHLEQALENLVQEQEALQNPLSYIGGPQVTVTPFGAIKNKGSLTAVLETGLQGTWWREPRWVKELNLTTDQQKKMDEAFRQNRIKLIDLSAALEKAELMLEPLVENVSPGDQAKILTQIDRVADARAELEKANARMLLAIREVLTQEQWSKLPSKTNARSFFYRPGTQ